jgi:hypothetical protein
LGLLIYPKGGIMFIKEEVEERKVKENHRWGTPVLRTRRRTVYHLKCDECGNEFTRLKGEMSKRRLSDEYNHFCKECFEYSKAADLGRDAHIKTLESRIGNKVIDSEGYVRVYVGPESSDKRIYQFHNDYCGSIREHTLVMENHLGRPMEKGEVVHHIDGNKTNNKISNLQKMTVTEHNDCHAANDKLVMKLYKEGVIRYDRRKKRYFAAS